MNERSMGGRASPFQVAGAAAAPLGVGDVGTAVWGCPGIMESRGCH